jgi:hypothetical protein
LVYPIFPRPDSNALDFDEPPGALLSPPVSEAEMPARCRRSQGGCPLDVCEIAVPGRIARALGLG